MASILFGFNNLVQDILFPNHGPHKGIKSTNIQRKKHNRPFHGNCGAVIGLSRRFGHTPVRP